MLFFYVILGLSFLMSLPDSFFLVILGLDPRIHRQRPERSVVRIVLQRPRCSGGNCEGHKGTVIAGFFFLVIAGLDPAIHVNKLALLLTWIPGSKPGDD